MLLVVFVSVLFLCKNILATELVPKILVNHMVLRAQLGGFQHVYHYADGDVVDAACVSLYTRDNCLVTFMYDYAEALDDVFKSHNLGSYQGVGFRAKMTAIHNNSRLVCKCAGARLHTVVNFILKQKFNDIVQLNINGVILREVSGLNKDIEIRVQKYGYEKYRMNENIEVQLNTVDGNVALNWYPPPNNPLTIYGNNNTIIKFSMEPEAFNMIVTLADNYSKVLIRTMKINFIPLPFSSTKQKWLIQDLPKDNALMELYNYDGQQKIYYEYEEDDVMDLECGTSVTVATLEGRIDVLGLENIDADRLKDARNTVRRKLQLSSAQNNSVIQCVLQNSGSSNARSYLFLRYKRPVLQILVNRIRLNTQRELDNNVNRSAEYHYKSGEVIDVSCIKLADFCTTMLNFSHADRLDDIFESTDMMSPYAVGFKTTLYESDDKSYMVCKCVCPSKTTKFKVTFKLQDDLDDYIHKDIKLVINNQTIKKMISKEPYRFESSKLLHLTYYAGHEPIHVEACSQRDNTSLHWSFIGPQQIIERHSMGKGNSSIFVELRVTTRDQRMDLYIYAFDKQLQTVTLKISFVFLSRYSLITLVSNKLEGNPTKLSTIIWWLPGVVAIAVIIIGIINYLRKRKGSSIYGSSNYSLPDETENIGLAPTTSNIVPSAPMYEKTPKPVPAARNTEISTTLYVNQPPKPKITMRNPRRRPIEEHIYECVD